MANPAKLTIMAFLAGDNDLTPFCINVLQQLESVKYRDGVCVLTCLDSNTPWPKGSRYFSVNCPHRSPEEDESKPKSEFDWEMDNDLYSTNEMHAKKESNFFERDYKSMPFTRPVVKEGLKRFLDWAFRHHGDSERFMLILFGHGPIVAGQNFLLAENPPSYLRMTDLKEVLDSHFGPKHSKKRKLDVLAFQNCAMNGIEMAWEIRDYVDVMVGSQGLVLANGWPYKEMISAIVKRPDAEPMKVARMMLETCARNLIDFAVIGRSSEQSACDIKFLREESQITTSLENLVEALIEGLKFEEEKKNGRKKSDKENIKKKELAYPAIGNAITLARLEAQSYFGELYVDLYDFCERLIKRCDRIFLDHQSLLRDLKLLDEASHSGLLNTGLIERTKNIIKCCLNVRTELEKLVPGNYSFYIGSQLQYSRGLSIYFPWTLPTGPYFPKQTRNNSRDYLLKTPWDTYCTYSFVKDSKWTEFLRAFFQATLRGVRRNDRIIQLNDNPSLDEGLTEENNLADRPRQGLITEDYPSMQNDLLITDLQKSSPDTGRVDSDLWSSIKNYPRRNYLSPADADRRIATEARLRPGGKDFKEPKSPPVSPLGWNISGLVAEVIRKKSSKTRQSRKRVPAKALTKAASS